MLYFTRRSYEGPLCRHTRWPGHPDHLKQPLVCSTGRRSLCRDGHETGWMYGVYDRRTASSTSKLNFRRGEGAEYRAGVLEWSR